MSEKKFLAYMPSGAEITCPEKFIDFYSEAYFYDPATRDLKLPPGIMSRRWCIIAGEPSMPTT